MILKFTFFYKDSNLNYFLNVILKVAKNYNIKSAYEISDENLYFFASGENLQDFANALERAIPMSLYFKIKDVELCKKDIDFNANLQDCEIFMIDEINAIKNPQSPHFCDIFTHNDIKIFYNDFKNATFNKSDSNKIIDSKESLKNVLVEIADLLQNGHIATLQTSKGKIALSLKATFPSDLDNTQNTLKTRTMQNTINSANFDYILANDIASVELFSRASKDEIEKLASFEKPIINLNIKDVFIDELHCKNTNFILPYDIILYCLSGILLERGILFVFIKKIESMKLNLSYDLRETSEFFEIVVGANGTFLKKNILDSSVSFDRFLAINFKDFGGDSAKKDDIFIAYISSNNPTFIAKSSDNMPFVNINFDKNPKNILQKIASLENGVKLIANFTNSFREQIALIDSLDSTPQFTQNILDIFEVAAIFLGCEADKNIILNYAQSYLRSIGPKVDFKNIEIDGTLIYNEILTIRSIMSFCLAGVEKEVLCFGIVESLVDYLILFFRKAQERFYIKNIGIVGDMFANKIFFDKITRKIPTSFNLVYPEYLELTLNK